MSNESILWTEISRVYQFEERNCWHRHLYKIYKWWQKNYATYQNNKLASLSDPVQMKIYQSSYYRRLKLATFWQWAKGLREAASEEPAAYRSDFVAYLEFSSSS